MKLEAVELRRIRISLVAPFETSFGTQLERDILLLKATTDQGEGWGECVAGEEPDYSSAFCIEFTGIAWRRRRSRWRCSTRSCVESGNRSRTTSARCARRSTAVCQLGSILRYRPCWRP